MEILLRSIFLGEIRAMNEEEEKQGLITHPISSMAVDSYGSIVWFADVNYHGEDYKMSTRGGQSPPILLEHGGSWMAANYNPLGVNQKLWIEGDGKSPDTKLLALSKFDLDDPAAKERLRKHKAGYVKGWSIGFIPKRTLRDEEADDFLKAIGREERGIVIHLAPTLWEYSSVLWPSNIDAYDKTAQEELIKNAMISLGYKPGADYENLERRIKNLENELSQIKAPSLRVKDKFPFLTH